MKVRRTVGRNLRTSAKAAMVVLALTILVAAARSGHGQSAAEGARLRAIMPLGSDVLLLQPAKKLVSMLLTVECKELDEVRIVEKDSRLLAVREGGGEVTKYPQEIKFRFTVGSRNLLGERQPLEVQTSATPEQFAAHLHFRLKVFHGVESQTIVPAQAKIIGVPPEMPYDERIYRISFKLNDIPVSDRMMFEVLDDSGTRVAKFHFQLM